MKRKAFVSVMAVLIGLSITCPTVHAAETQKPVTQGELAKLLTPILDIEVKGTSALENQIKLAENKVAPMGGWNYNDPNTVVTKADLAVVIGRILGYHLEGWFIGEDAEPEPQTEEEWIALLKKKGVPFLSVGQATHELGPLAVKVSDGSEGVTTDPLLTGHVVQQPHSLEGGAFLGKEDRPAQALTKQDVAQVIQQVVRPRRRRPMTP